MAIREVRYVPSQSPVASRQSPVLNESRNLSRNKRRGMMTSDNGTYGSPVASRQSPVLENLQKLVEQRK